MRATHKWIGLCLVLLLMPFSAWGQQSKEKREPWETADWPQWRGHRGDGVSSETGLDARWPEAGPAEVWRRPLGGGFSGIVVAGGRLYTQFSDGGDTFLASFSAKDGSELWRTRMGPIFKDSYGNGPRATPTLRDGIVYALSSSGDLIAARSGNGEILWQSNLRESFGARVPRWGLAGSPLVEGKLLIVPAGGDGGSSVLALDRMTGELRWSARDEKTGYATPIVMTLDGVRQLLVFAGDRIVSLKPMNGESYWELDWKTDWGVNASTPIRIDDHRVFLSTGYDRGAIMLDVRKKDGGVAATELWRNREMRNKFSSSVLYGGHLYGFDEGTLKCLDPEAGTTLWQQRGLGHGSLFAADGKLIALSDKGKLVLADATPEGYKELGSVQAFTTKTWTVPTLAGGRLYLRDEKEIVAFDISN